MMIQSGHTPSTTSLDTPQIYPGSAVSQAMKVVKHLQRHPYLHPDDCPIDGVDMSIRQAITTLNNADEEYL